MGPIKLKSFCTAQETINKMKRQPPEWEKIYANNVMTRGYFQIIQKAHTAQYKTNNPIKKWT